MAKTSKKPVRQAAGNTSILYFGLVLSEDCEKCPHQCDKGLRYIDNVHRKRFGKGIVCPKK